MFSLFFGDFVLITLLAFAIVWFADFLKRRRDDDFLYALDQIINKKDYEKKTDKKTDE